LNDLSPPDHKGAESIDLVGRDAVSVGHSWPAQDVDQFIQSRLRIEEHVAAVAEEVDHRTD
jgi:hypothetical protein